MATKKRQPVLGSVLERGSSDETVITEIPALNLSESADHARIFSTMDGDTRRQPVRERRRVFEVLAMDGRTLMSVEVDG